MQEDDLVRLKAMQDAARRALTFAEGKTRADLTDDMTLCLFTKKALEIIGTAASKTSRECKKRHGDFPWITVAGFGKRSTRKKALQTADLDRMWTIVTGHLPALPGLIEDILERERDTYQSNDGG